MPIIKGTYQKFHTQAANDAQARGYGGETYPVYLERRSLETVAYYVRQGDLEAAQRILNRSLGDALAGNDGD